VISETNTRDRVEKFPASDGQIACQTWATGNSKEKALSDLQIVNFCASEKDPSIAAIEPSGKKELCLSFHSNVHRNLYRKLGYCLIDAAPFLIVQSKRLASVFLNNHLLSFLISLLQLIHNL
jgi:hypothetical protein